MIYQRADVRVQISFYRADLVGQVSDETFIFASTEQAKIQTGAILEHQCGWPELSLNSSGVGTLFRPGAGFVCTFPNIKTNNRKTYPLFIIVSLHNSPKPNFSIDYYQNFPLDSERLTVIAFIQSMSCKYHTGMLTTRVFAFGGWCRRCHLRFQANSPHFTWTGMGWLVGAKGRPHPPTNKREADGDREQTWLKGVFSFPLPRPSCPEAKQCHLLHTSHVFAAELVNAVRNTNSLYIICTVCYVYLSKYLLPPCMQTFTNTFFPNSLP